MVKIKGDLSMFIYLAMIDSPEEKLKFEIIYERYKGLMFYTANSVLGDTRDSEDIFVNDMGEPYQPNYVTQHFKLVLRKNHLRNIRFHDLRHTCASLLLKNGVPMKDIQEWLGHSSYNTTANIYAHLDTSSKNTSASKMSNVVIIEPGISTSV